LINAADIAETWEVLAGLQAPTDEMRVREVDAITTPDGHPLLALDRQQRRHLLIPAGAGYTVAEDRRSSGVQVLGHELLDGVRLRQFVDLVCLKPHLDELFSVVVGEVLINLAADMSDPSRTCRQVLDRWRELMDRERTDQPGLETLTGLFGELRHLRRVIEINPDAVDRWVGPTGARHDLLGAGTAIEVKSSRIRRGRFVQIHGHEQLEPPVGGELFLASMKLEPVPAGGESVAELIDSLCGLGADRHQLFSRLHLLGIGQPEIEFCRTVRFEVREDRVYRVDESIPKIVASSFAGGGLPAGILSLTYEIDLSLEPPYPLEQADISEVYRKVATHP
jgi:hypothetical protein